MNCKLNESCTHTSPAVALKKKDPEESESPEDGLCECRRMHILSMFHLLNMFFISFLSFSLALLDFARTAEYSA